MRRTRKFEFKSSLNMIRIAPDQDTYLWNTIRAKAKIYVYH